MDAIQVEKLTDNLFVLRAGGGATAAFITANGVLLVDTKVSGWGQPIIQKLKTLTDKPVTTIVNTHTHFDHVNGNAEFPATVDVVTQENTKRYMEQWNPVFGLTLDNPSPFKANGGVGLPKRTFKDNMTLFSGNESVDLHFYGPAHTGGDTWVVFRAARVMHAGDAFAGKNAPIMDKNNGGSAVRYAETIARAAKTPNVDHSHHRPQHHDDDGGPEGVRRVQRRFREGRPGGEEGRENRRAVRGRVERAGQVHRLHQSARRRDGRTQWRSNAQVVWDEANDRQLLSRLGEYD